MGNMEFSSITSPLPLSIYVKSETETANAGARARSNNLPKMATATRAPLTTATIQSGSLVVFDIINYQTQQEVNQCGKCFNFRG